MKYLAYATFKLGKHSDSIKYYKKIPHDAMD